MADGAVNFLLDRLATILAQNASLLGDARNEIEDIKLEFESMRSFLGDAERIKERNESVETWVRQVREVSNQVEDIIDEFMHYNNIQEDKKGLNHFVKDIIGLPKHMSARRRISSKLQKIKAKVHEVSERSKRYAFDDDKTNVGKGRNNTSVDWWQQHHGESCFFVEEDEIVGMDRSEEQLLEWLAENDMRRTIISIVGMGGLGKTTLVTKVFNHPLIKRQFDCWAWISVPQTNGIEELLRSMVKEFLRAKQVMIPSNLASMKYRQLVEMLIEYMHQKRYVVVLDDVWSIVLWSKIRVAFPDNSCGSRVIFTTRNENVATSVGPGSRIHRLKPLQESDAWALFCKKAFWSHPDLNCPLEIEALAKAIMRKCEGLPLAIVAIGGLMCSRNKTAVEWKTVYNSLNWQLSNNPMLEPLKSILLLSFNDLPFYLKHCFLYCCVFHDGSPIKRKKLIRLWAAEGFIMERKGMTMEEVAEDYLMELIFRSMIQVTETNDAGREKTFRVHDVMRELAVTTAEKENFCTAYDGRESRLEGKTQRLSVYNRGESIQLSKTMSHHLRSFFVFETDTGSSFSLNEVSSNFRLLRVLDVQGVSIEKIPSTVVDLFNLRYLNLRKTKVRKLPKSIERLRQLQTLDVRNTNIKELPNGISKLQKLRHLFLCRNNNNQDTETLDFLCGMRVPEGIGHIRSLQTLSCIEVEGELIQQVGNLTELKRLDISRLRSADGLKLCSSIQKMTSLRRLSVMAHDEQEELQLEPLHLPPMFLQKMTLVGQLIRLPHWVGSLANLTHLHLCSSHLEQDLLSSLNKLPTLVFLELKKAYNGRLLHFKADGFLKLRKLNLQDLIQLDSIRMEKGALPIIKDLYLVRCQGLSLLPQGIEHLTSLQKLHLEEMPVELVQRLQSDTSEYHTKLRMGT